MQPSRNCFCKTWCQNLEESSYLIEAPASEMSIFVLVSALNGMVVLASEERYDRYIDSVHCIRIGVASICAALCGSSHDVCALEAMYRALVLVALSFRPIESTPFSWLGSYGWKRHSQALQCSFSFDHFRTCSRTNQKKGCRLVFLSVHNLFGYSCWRIISRTAVGTIRKSRQRNGKAHVPSDVKYHQTSSRMYCHEQFDDTEWLSLVSVSTSTAASSGKVFFDGSKLSSTAFDAYSVAFKRGRADLWYEEDDIFSSLDITAVRCCCCCCCCCKTGD